MEFIKLYEVNDKIMNAIDMETGEILIPEEEFDALIKAGENGCEYFVALFKNAKATMQALKEEKKARDDDFATRIKACENTMNWATRVLNNYLQGNAWQGQNGKVSYRKSTTTEPVDVDAFLKWDGRFQYMDYQPNFHKEDIGNAIKEGKEIVGWSRVDHDNIQIK